MTKLGYSEKLKYDFLQNIDSLDLTAFNKQHNEELHHIHIEKFFGELVPVYFTDNVITEIPSTGKVLDIGCGRGTLVNLLLERGDNEIVGIDIFDSPEWEEIRSKGVRLEVVPENKFLEFIRKEKPGVVSLTWVLHHMKYKEQKKYLTAIFKSLKEDSTLVVLEDSYAETLTPENGKDIYKSFMKWDEEDRYKIMGTLDWTANIVLGQKAQMPVPFSYRTLEGWKELIEEVGFEVTKTRFLGFPDNRDIDTPQSILVAKR